MIRSFFISLSILLLATKQLLACEIDIYANAHMKPKAYIENGQPKGILIEMMDYIGADIGCKFTYHFSTWARAYKSMLDGKGGAIGLSTTQSRQSIIDFSDTMYNEEVLLVTNIKTPFTYTDVQDLAGKTVSTSRGALIGDEFERGIRENIFTFIGDNGDPAHRLRLVAKGRLDVAIISPGLYAFNNVFTEHPELLPIKEQLYIVPTPFTIDSNHLGFSKQNDHKDFLKKFNLSIKKARKKGVFQAIEKKYQH
ncbi:MAG: polar amino acid transport system substrate-binding protein [Psychromonas sp.]|jgi:polar amino acid transport system substrate-binding protein|uniref:substrate-binding periplasmic protein n=1 Tax=Psychromonas sp. TaxID=1884585 RepID=UPI0039E4A56D